MQIAAVSGIPDLTNKIWDHFNYTMAEKLPSQQQPSSMAQGILPAGILTSFLEEVLEVSRLVSRKEVHFTHIHDTVALL